MYPECSYRKQWPKEDKGFVGNSLDKMIDKMPEDEVTKGKILEELALIVGKVNELYGALQEGDVPKDEDVLKPKRQISVTG